jgi:hypothetical protein
MVEKCGMCEWPTSVRIAGESIPVQQTTPFHVLLPLLPSNRFNKRGVDQSHFYSSHKRQLTFKDRATDLRIELLATEKISSLSVTSSYQNALLYDLTTDKFIRNDTEIAPLGPI